MAACCRNPEKEKTNKNKTNTSSCQSNPRMKKNARSTRLMKKANKSRQFRNFIASFLNTCTIEHQRQFANMASCSFSSLFNCTTPCGSSSRNPQDLQCVTLKECREDVNPHLKSLKVSADEAIRDEMTLLLVRAGKVFL